MSDTPTSKVEALRETVTDLMDSETDFYVKLDAVMQAFATFLEGFTEEQKENIRISNGRLYGEMVSVEALHQVVTALRGGE